jgi:translation initiation factor 2B subunit (eIF-2B alpha/beta/delta family)
MDPRLSEIAETLAKDGTSGASEMHASILNSLLAISDEDLTGIPASEWEDFCVSIYRSKPSIAPVFNIANSIMLRLEQGERDGSSLHEGLVDMLDRERKSGARIAERAAKVIKGRWFMTTSYSATVAQVLKGLAKDRRIKVTVAESTPGGEGRQFAKLLAEQGMEVEVIYDSTVFARMEHVDGAIVGADSVTTAGLVNKVGTRALAEAARAEDVNAFAVCGWSKICPVVLSNLGMRTESLGKRLTEHVQVFESSPLDLFTSVITDQGELSSADLRMELKVRKVARAWYTRGVIQRT